MFNQKTNLLLKALEWLIFSVLILVIFIILSPLFHFKSLPSTFIVASGSMEPVIKTGSIVVTNNVNPKSVVIGDIVAFTSPNNPKDTILHRIVKVDSIDPQIFQTKGDSNKSPDNWKVRDTDLKGKYLFSIPYLGHIGAFIRKPLGFSLVIGIPALLFIIFQVFIIKKAIDEEVERKVAKSLGSQKLPIVLIFLTALYTFSRVPYIKALYSDTAKIGGIRITIANFNSDGDDEEENDDDENDHEDNHNDDENRGEKEHKKPKLQTKLHGDKHHYSFYLSNIEDFYDCEYEVTYKSKNTTKGFKGRVDLHRQSEFSKEDILLGSKSFDSGEDYDEDVKDFKFSIHLTRPDGTRFDMDSEGDY